VFRRNKHCANPVLNLGKLFSILENKVLFSQGSSEHNYRKKVDIFSNLIRIWKIVVYCRSKWTLEAPLYQSSCLNHKMHRLKPSLAVWFVREASKIWKHQKGFKDLKGKQSHITDDIIRIAYHHKKYAVCDNLTSFHFLDDLDVNGRKIHPRIRLR